MKEYKYKINGNTYNVGIGDIDGNIVQVEVNGMPYKVELSEEPKAVRVSTPKAAPAPRTSSGEKVITKPAAAPTGGYQIKAPLPGVVVSVSVKVGDSVKASDTVAILEAMKMENAIHAGRDGVVKAINANAGDSVLEGAPIITLD